MKSDLGKIIFLTFSSQRLIFLFHIFITYKFLCDSMIKLFSCAFYSLVSKYLTYKWNYLSESKSKDMVL